MRAISYSRVSADDLRQMRSVGEQEEANRGLIDTMGWTLVENGSFVDNDRSASRFARKGRPGFQDLLQALSAGRCDVLVLWESSRGSRTLTEWSQLLDLCRDQGVSIHVWTHRRTYDLSIARDWKTLAEDGVNNAYASEETRDRIMRTIDSNAQSGRPHGRIKYGYIREYDGRGRFLRQVIHEDEAAVVREIADRLLRGESTCSIVRDLNRRQVRTPGYESMMRNVADLRASSDEAERSLAETLEERAQRMEWDRTNLRQLMRSPSYAGLRSRKGRVVGPGNWPALLDLETHHELVALWADPSRQKGRPGAVRHLLTNVAMCDECGSTMKVQTVRQRFSYLCEQKFCVAISARWLEPFVERVIVARPSRPDAADLFRPKTDRSAWQAAASEAAALQAQLDEAVASVGPNGISVAMLGRLEQSLQPRIEDALRRAQPAVVPPALKLAASVAGVGARERWDALTVVQRKSVVRELAVIRVQRGRRGARSFDPARLMRSRWVGDSVTWGELGLA